MGFCCGRVDMTDVDEFRYLKIAVVAIHQWVAVQFCMQTGFFLACCVCKLAILAYVFHRRLGRFEEAH
jgi:hypothetical protein